MNVAIARHGKLAYIESFGFQDLEARKPMRPDTIFRMASMTKPIATSAVMMLYEEGKFLLDDPVSKFIPGLDKVKVLAREDSDGSQVVDLERPMTIRHLLTHTSGLSNAKAYQAAGVFARTGTLRDMAAKLPTVPLAHQPGQAWRYGHSIDVLGYLVEVWSGKTFDVFFEQRIFSAARYEGNRGRAEPPAGRSWPQANLLLRRRRALLDRRRLPSFLPTVAEWRPVRRQAAAQPGHGWIHDAQSDPG